MNYTFGFLIYENVQPIDFIGPWEVLSFWKNILNGSINLYLISEKGSYVQCLNDIAIKAHFDFNQAPPLDCLVVPGGHGRLAQVKNETCLSFIRKQADKVKYILSICTGIFLLHEAGILKNKSTTTYWRAIPELKAFPDVHTVEKRIVKDGNIWSAAGISSGIDLALEFIAEIAGKEVADRVQLLFEYFPKKQTFATLNSIDELPPYSMNPYPSYLPQYIRDYIKLEDNQEKD